ncbi:MAG: Xaa-Pro peptidase family protein [Clostridia bacterium]|nr:Xaa-Pro peptidase family protein [Clostridia bacterium]
MNRLPAIPESEYPKRWEQVRAMMDREELDLLLLYSDDRATFGSAHARWLAGFMTHFEPTCILFVKAADEPIMLVGPETPGYARIHSRIKDIRVLRELTHPDEDYPYTTIEPLGKIVASLTDASSIKRLGIAGRSLIPYDLFRSFMDALPGQWVSADEPMGEMRQIKTEAEIRVIRYAYQIAEAGLEAALEVIAPGASERRVAAAAEYAMRSMGAECYGIDTMVASGVNSSPIIARTTMREIGKDDLVLLTFAPRYEGYHAAIGLPVLVGNPCDEARRAAEAAIRAQKACAAMLKAGQTCAAEGEARRIMQEAGFGGNFLYSGIHSVGVIEFEPPIFGPSSNAVMRQDMVLSVDIPVFDGPWGGLRLEDGYLIEKHSARRLTRFDYAPHR